MPALTQITIFVGVVYPLSGIYFCIRGLYKFKADEYPEEWMRWSELRNYLYAALHCILIGIAFWFGKFTWLSHRILWSAAAAVAAFLMICLVGLNTWLLLQRNEREMESMQDSEDE